MKLKNKILVLSLFLVLICCLGAVSATEDINETITTDSSIDDVNTVSVEDTVDEIISDDTENTKVIENQNDDSSQMTRGTPVTASNWTELEYQCEYYSDRTITLTGTVYTASSQISFENSATIIGNSNSYITGGTTSLTPFLNIYDDLTITFVNVHFKNMYVQNLLELDGTVYLENCTFDNIQTANGHNSVVYNTNNYMYLTGCNITNCKSGYGAVTNYNSASQTSVVMYVDKCKFINNTATVEPGAINNCGILYVNNSEFIGNHANWWAGAIHTHTNAQTYIENSIFRGNTAGWNGGALFTYSKLQIFNSTFENNNCTTNNGGGAIGAYNYGSGYNITIDSCRFNNNINLCKAYDNLSTTSLGRGGAISVLNGGYLDVHNSNFTANYARIGQAIAAATYTYENGTGGNPHIKIYNNRFVDHTANGIDTVVITGTDYIFNNNRFINSYQNTHYTGTGNNYNAANLMLINPQASESKNKLKLINSDVLGTYNSDILSLTNSDVFYVNISSSSDPETVDGQSWATAFGTPSGITAAKIYINDGGIIYLANGDYKYRRVITIDEMKNITFIGQGQDTLINNFLFDYNNVGNTTYTFINMTFFNTDFNRNCTFINCNFKNDITFFKNFNSGKYEDRYFEEHGFLKTYSLEFINCTFGQTTTDSYYMGVNRCAQLNFNNCTFKDIVANSLVYRIAGYFEEDSISFKDCTFTNCKFNGVVDSAANFDDAIIIEDCNYDDEVAVGTTEVNGHFYVNATKLKVVAVETNTSITSSEKGIVTITVKDAEGNPVANANVNYTVNGENKTGITDGNGILKVSDLTGEGEIKAYFEGNENYLKSEGSYKYNFTESKPAADTNSSTSGTSTNTPTTKVTKKATKITAKKKTFKAKKKTKKYTIVLKAGKAAVKKVKVTLKVGKKTYKATTNSKGKATFKITKLNKKGKYTAVIKFKGNKNFKATSKKVKITVKK